MEWNLMPVAVEKLHQQNIRTVILSSIEAVVKKYLSTLSIKLEIFCLKDKLEIIRN